LLYYPAKSPAADSIKDAVSIEKKGAVGKRYEDGIAKKSLKNRWIEFNC